MFIKALAVEGIGRFAAGAHVEGFNQGVNVLAAGNEVGKSTLFKAIRTCLFTRHDSKTADIRDLASDGSQLPATIELTFDQNGRTYVIKKSFLRSPSATLSENGREIARFKQADEAVWDLLGLRPGSGRTLDDGAFGLLWVGQGASFAPPAPGAAAASLLSSAIESEVGALVGGERARHVLDDVTSGLRRFLTASEQHAKADGPLHAALGSAEQWRGAEADNQTKLAALETQFEELRQQRRRLRELTDPATAEQLRQDFSDARKSLADARAATQELRTYEAEETSAKRGAEAAAQRLGQHRELIARIDANRRVETALAQELPQLEAREQEGRSAVARTLEQNSSLDAAFQTLSRREQQAARLDGALTRAQRRNEVARQLKALELAAQELRDTDAQLAQIRLKPKMVDDLDELDRQIASLDAQLAAAAAQIAVEVKPQGAGQVRIGGARAKASYSAAVVSPIKIGIADIAEITVTPAAHPRREKRQELDEQRSSLLKSAGIATVTEAHALLSKRRELDANRKAVLAQLKTFKVVDDPEAAIGKLKTNLAETEAAIAAALADAGRERLPTEQELDAEKIALEQERTSIEGRRANLEQVREQQQEALENAVESRSGAVSKLELIRNRVAEDVALCPDADRPARDATLVLEVTRAETANRTASATLAAMRETTPDAAEIERRQARCERLEQALANRNDEIRQLEHDIGRLTGQIQTAGGDGVGEALAVAQEQRGLAERECARLQDHIAALKLLRDTVAACLTEGREHYYQPVRRHLRPFLNDLFPGSELELGEGFAITGIKRHRSELFERLSDGTQEQIAVLVRLAMGAMLAERGQVVPIILDDALVYCDDDRIQRMFDALSRAGKHQQIIVLTCRLRTFGPLGGHILRVHTNAECAPPLRLSA
jgi:DNA repair exonuclease SbcCD ATPase subunit